MNYLFVGEDEFSKDIKLSKIKRELFSPQLESFNFDTLYAKELNLKTLQEKLLLLPVKARQRLILIKQTQKLSSSIKEYLSSYLKNPLKHVSLILDVRGANKKDMFFTRISSLVRVVNFWESTQINSFTLAHQVLQRRAKPALRLLRQLLLQGEKPERILGALRYQLREQRLDVKDRKRKLDLLLNCDIDIKTGRLKPELALEQLLFRWCCL